MDIKVLFSAFVVFYNIFFRCDVLDPTWTGWLANGILLAFIPINWKMFKLLLEREYKFINILSLLWLGIIIYSGYVNQDLSYDDETWDGVIKESMTSMQFNHVMYYALKFLLCILYYEYLTKVKKGALFLEYFMKMMLVFAAISDANALVYNSEDGSGYLIGNKFYVCYVNIFAVTLFYFCHPQLDKKKKKKLLILLLVSLLIAVRTQCSTVIMGTLIMYFLIFGLKHSLRPALYKWKTYLLGLAIFDFLFFFYTMSFIDNPVMKFLIVDVLGEDMTLTGRLGIYAALGELLNQCPLYGFGVGNAHLMTMMVGVGPNAQNGFFNYMLEVGILGMCVFLLLLLELLRKGIKNYGTYAVVCFIYMMLVLSSIEVTFTTYFFAMALLLLINNEKQNRTITYERKY